MILKIQGLRKRFGGLTALNGLDFEIEEGMIMGLIGPNGAGKTTLFNCLTGVYESIDGGTMLFMNRNIVGLKSHAVTRLGISRTFQNIRLFNNMTALENVMVGGHCRMKAGLWGAVVRGVGTVQEEREAVERAVELLDFVGLNGKEDIPAKNLPYGDQRRLEIARAMATEPKLLLLDEPTAGMNPQETAETTRLIDGIRRRSGIAVLLIEHDMRVVMGISDWITVLDYGVKISEGRPAEVKRDPRVIEAYLGKLGSRL